MRRSFLTEGTLVKAGAALDSFRKHREFFRTSGVREDFSLPRQHSLDHYLRHARSFAAPNGLCSSITESKHIAAVKEPWRRSNRYNALGQMLLTNQRLDKMAAARADYNARGMINGSIFTAALLDMEAREVQAARQTVSENVSEDREEDMPEQELPDLDEEEDDEQEEDHDEGRDDEQEEDEQERDGLEDGPIDSRNLDAEVLLAKRQGELSSSYLPIL